ncbi:MAG: ribokinase [Acidimicrobiia bacterium]|nr:ribokinase [Acidimicrobiia bacterium]
MAAEIVVVGSLNQDTTVRVARLPHPGETVLGQGHFSDTGGKGANQAVAAARLGGSVAMIGMVGADASGARLLQSLRAAGVAVDEVGRSADAATGLALITVDEHGENMIVVSPGANAALRPSDVRSSSATLEQAVITMLQLEIRIDTVAEAAARSGGTVILNPAPARFLDPRLLVDVDVLIPNRTELAELAGAPESLTIDDAARLASAIRGPQTVVVTLGSDGALLVEDGEVLHVGAVAVEAVDPTGAGDAFCAGFADALVRGASTEDAVRWAVRCGAAATLRWGAQAALPTREDVERLADS